MTTMAVIDESHRKAARGDINRARRHLGRAAKRRAVPPWAAPLGFIALLMGSGPQLPMDVAPAGRGLGLGLQIREAPLFRRVIGGGFARIRTVGRTPSYWRTSQGNSWPEKTEGATDIGDAAFGLRTVHILAHLGKARHAGNSSRPPMPHAVHGFTTGRCNENAVIT
eukprot:8190493-Pyramimonas_sp.AAC.1